MKKLIYLSRYRECLRNHAASLGSYAIDGCGQFIPDDSIFNCAACSCHHNFHRKVSKERIKPETSSSKKRYRTSLRRSRRMGFADNIEIWSPHFGDFGGCWSRVLGGIGR
ncbi:hypothetical protein ACS0TY_021489 [Phlomoides rotata]